MEGKQMELFQVSKYLDVEHTIAKYMFDPVENPWEVLPSISIFIEQLGPMLPSEEFEQRGSNVWISKSAVIAPTAYHRCRHGSPSLCIYPWQCDHWQKLRDR